MLMNEYLVLEAARERAARLRAQAAIEAQLRAVRARRAARSSPDIGLFRRLAIIALTVITLGMGVVGLKAAVSERPPRAEVVPGLTEWDEWTTGIPGRHHETPPPRAIGREQLRH